MRCWKQQEDNWLARASVPLDPAFFTECHDLDDLMTKLGQGLVPPGTAFYLGDLCFIQTTARPHLGDKSCEYAVYRRGVLFEELDTMSMADEESGEAEWFRLWYAAVLAASDEELETSDYQDRIVRP